MDGWIVMTAPFITKLAPPGLERLKRSHDCYVEAQTKVPSMVARPVFEA